jgi:hypothetical protein
MILQDIQPQSQKRVKLNVPGAARQFKPLLLTTSNPAASPLDRELNQRGVDAFADSYQRSTEESSSQLADVVSLHFKSAGKPADSKPDIPSAIRKSKGLVQASPTRQPVRTHTPQENKKPQISIPVTWIKRGTERQENVTMILGNRFRLFSYDELQKDKPVPLMNFPVQNAHVVKVFS